MSAPAADDVSLLPVEEMAGQFKRDWPFVATRAAVAALVPVLATLLAKALDFYGPVAQLGLPLEFLAVGPFAYEAKVIWFVVLVLVLSSFLTRERAPQLVLALATGAILWTGFVFTRLQWSKLFVSDFDLVQMDAPSPLAWLWAILLLVVATLYALAESMLETRRAQLARQLREDEAQALLDVSARATATAALGGLALAAALGAAIWLLRPLAKAPPFRLNPVFVLFGMGILVAAAVVLAARRRALGGDNAFMSTARHSADLPPPPRLPRKER